MKLPKTAITTKITIFAPRYRDRVVLLDTRKVGEHNIIRFSEAKSMPDAYYVSGHTIRDVAEKEPMRTKSGGTMMMYVLPLNELELFEGRDAS